MHNRVENKERRDKINIYLDLTKLLRQTKRSVVEVAALTGHRYVASLSLLHPLYLLSPYFAHVGVYRSLPAAARYL